ncbi:hypothetical protein ACQKEI_05120 [Psychrobacter namhaensis]|uniref:hypothetical protein n=1 Tax=Psychrobacter namhaensis TaxID=292734 RepID=UPI003D024BD4
MSFLNPVNEPVLRFKSTDAGAPQINYNARVAGDVKAVLKACLVTGYGAKASAGWTAVNETATVVEFVSPSVAMSDYRLGIDDTSTSSTTWYYQYQDVRINPSYNDPTKSWSYIDKTHASNGWELFVTQRGVIFLEYAHFTSASGMTSRVTFLGEIKSGATTIGGSDFVFFNVGHSATLDSPFLFYRPNYPHIKVGGVDCAFVDAMPTNATQGGVELGKSVISLFSTVYICASNRKSVLAELPAVQFKTINSLSELYKLTESDLGGRPTLIVCLGQANLYADQVNYARLLVIYLDYWEY